MTRNHIKTYQNPELEEKWKLITNNTPQVSQFSQVPGFGEIKKSNSTNSTNNQIPKNIDIEKLKLFLGEDWDDYKANPKALELWSNLLLTNNLIDQGKVPVRHVVR